MSPVSDGLIILPHPGAECNPFSKNFSYFFRRGKNNICEVVEERKSAGRRRAAPASGGRETVCSGHLPRPAAIENHGLLQQAQNGKLDGDHNKVLHNPGDKEHVVGRAVEDVEPEGGDAQAYHQAVYRDRGGNVLPVDLLPVEEEAENHPGEEGGEGDTGEVGADGEENGAQEVGHTACHARPHRPMQHAADGQGDKGKADLQQGSGDGAEAGENDLDGDKQGQMNQEHNGFVGTL